MNRLRGKIFSMVVLGAYIALSFFGAIILFSQGHASTDMSMDCPYTQGAHSMCQMDAIGHIKAWKSLTTTLVTGMTFVVLLVAFFGFKLDAFATFVQRVRFRHRLGRQYSPYVLLFAQGILNPKIF